MIAAFYRQRFRGRAEDDDQHYTLFILSVYFLTGTGQMAGVEFDFVSGGLSEPELGELRDISAQHFIRFDEQNPETTTDKTLVIKNTT